MPVEEDVMQRMWGWTIAVAAVTALGGGAKAADPAQGEEPAVAVQTTLGELLGAAARELGVVLLYDDGLAGRRVALSGASQGVTAKSLLDQALHLRGLQLEIDASSRTGRVVQSGRTPTVLAVALPSGAHAAAQPPEQLVTRVYHLTHADPLQISNVLRGYLRNTSHEWVNATRNPGGAVVVTVQAERLPALESVIAQLDQPATSGEVAEVVTLRHGRAAQLAPLVARLCASETEGLRAEAGPDGTSVALAGSRWRIAQAKTLLAGLDVPSRE